MIDFWELGVALQWLGGVRARAKSNREAHGYLWLDFGDVSQAVVGVIGE
jgi:hypothetical protein